MRLHKRQLAQILASSGQGERSSKEDVQASDQERQDRGIYTQPIAGTSHRIPYNQERRKTTSKSGGRSFILYNYSN
jgi:hypothetical protein